MYSESVKVLEKIISFLDESFNDFSNSEKLEEREFFFRCIENFYNEDCNYRRIEYALTYGNKYNINRDDTFNISISKETGRETFLDDEELYSVRLVKGDNDLYSQYKSTGDNVIFYMNDIKPKSGIEKKVKRYFNLFETKCNEYGNPDLIKNKADTEAIEFIKFMKCAIK